MNDMRTLLMATAFLAATGVSQDPGSSPSAGKPAVGNPAVGNPEARQGPGSGAATKADIQKWIRQLGSDSYRARLEAETKLLELGGQESGKQVRSALEAAAGDDRDGEVQWRAKRVLSRIEKALGAAGRGGADPGDADPGEHGDRGSGGRGGPRSGLTERRRDDDQDPRPLRERARTKLRDMWRDEGRFGPGVIRFETGDIQKEFDRLFERMERDFGLDVPRRRFFGDTFFQDLRSQLQPMRLRDLPGASGGMSSGRGTSVQIGPEGVVVEVTETDEDGKVQTKQYEAPDMETFRKNHPDVLQDSGLGFGLRSFPSSPLAPRPLSPRRLRGNLDPRVRDEDRGTPAIPGAIEPAAPPAGERLGVLVEPIPDALRNYLELGPETGLMVGSVQPGSLAEALKLQAGDIVTHINKSRIGGPPDVRRALAKVGKGEPVKVAVIRRGRELEVDAKKQHDAGAGRVPLNKRTRRATIR